MLKNNPLVLVFCKNQIIGKVKSRLALKIGQKKAFLIYSELVNKTGAQTVAFAFLVNLTFLEADKRLKEISETIISIVNYW